MTTETPQTPATPDGAASVLTAGLGPSAEVERYEYHLMFWGQVNNDKWVERDLGITEKDFWFRTKKERDQFKAKLAAVADAHNVIIAFSEHEGWDVRKRTIARMTFTLPDGRAFPFEYDFGYGYPLDSAEYMFMDGNYACDCNRSLFLSREHPEIEEFDCGDKIIMGDFVVTKEGSNASLSGAEPLYGEASARRES